MATAASANRSRSIWTGLLVAMVATAAWYFYVGWGTDLVNDGFLSALAIGSGSMFVVGLLLAVSRRTRRLGIGLAVGAPVAFVLAMVVLTVLIMSVTS